MQDEADKDEQDEDTDDQADGAAAQGGVQDGQIADNKVLYTPISYAIPLLLTVRTEDIFTTFDTRLPQERADELMAALNALRRSVTLIP